MRISQKHKFIYLSHGKTASTSIRNVLNCYCEEPLLEKRIGFHPDLKEMEHYCRQAKINSDDLYKFSFVRNPWDRVLSSYFYYKKLQSSTKAGREKTFLATTKSFDWWVRNVTTLNAAENNQYSRMINEKGDLSMDFIGKTENLEKDLNFVFRKLCLKGASIPKLNSTTHKHYSYYYDNFTSDIVYKICKKDIESFNYSFGD